MLWIKALHVGFIISWFAGIFYLPRLFVNSAMAEEAATRKQLAVMQRKLYRFMSLLGTLATVLGLVLLAGNWNYFISQNWMLAKLLLLVLLIAYHFVCGHFVRRFEQGSVEQSHIFFRYFNEAPVLLMFGIVILVIVRPF